MTDFLLELRSEEIPARMQKGARAELEKLFRAKLGEAGLTASAITVYSTPRRLALIAKDLADETQAVSEERKGPRADAPDKAIEGFLRSTGLTRDQLVEREDKKGNAVLFAVIETPGRATRDVLAEAIPAIVREFSWPKSMRWGAASQTTESLRWVRPLSGIVALFGEQVVECEVHGVTSGAVTLGHRFHHRGDITIGDADDYAVKLRAGHVIVDHEEREAIVRDGAAEAAADAGLSLVADEGLVVENAGLTEWPVPLLGRFDAAFLDVPQEVIQLTARVNQKYFVCEDGEGRLANAFVCTANIEATDGGAALVAGNEKVLAARLSDAKFFWDLDRKTSLAVHAEKLKDIVFHEKLGTVADKVDRVAKLARWLVEEGIVGDGEPETADLAQKAAELCKADLVTEMVGEFPELQGLMGGYYAAAEGLDPRVAAAIRDHYKPVGQGDDVPIAPVTVAVSLADKLDTLIQFFSEDLKPTGSKDPFALRRAALGVIQIIETSHVRLPVFETALRGLDSNWKIKSPVDFSAFADAARTAFKDRLTSRYDGDENRYLQRIWDLLDFFADRLKVQQREAGVRHDLIDAVFALGGEDDLVRLLARVKALQAFVETPEGTDLIAGYKRAANILKKEGTEAAAEQQNLSYTPEAAEKALIDSLAAAEPRARSAVEAEDFEGAMAALASLRDPIDRFFEGVTVNDEDETKRAARLALLSRFRAAVNQVADFSKIEG
ncbi:glycine--tRNA ligase subunit beta [Novosphingopyxis sp. YJ-S2-01]|uniref:glycine--tRNA ligase subunit beta n=1 Tax=Novosphingopyxis sp. YJ-S2-01 TaxID=2794021 RepID=UPI0018DC7D4D|nr:glycine--tRNA ligase subunit beta [Novosphingopyxis sp. YJ-S2-01]MBH9537810.1 glycine--tRNA ligase subunit beta [Novosphingopyxis sp. YJ-S2-01]